MSPGIPGPSFRMAASPVRSQASSVRSLARSVASALGSAAASPGETRWKPGENPGKPRGKPVENPDVLPGFTRFYWRVVIFFERSLMRWSSSMRWIIVGWSKNSVYLSRDYYFLMEKNMMHCGSSGLSHNFQTNPTRKVAKIGGQSQEKLRDLLLALRKKYKTMDSDRQNRLNLPLF